MNFGELSDDDRWSTQLEGKKLKGRGVAHKEEYYVDELLEIDEEIEREQEFFVDEELTQHVETEQEREERLKMELEAARRAQQELEKQMQRDQFKDPNTRLNKIEKGVILSQNEGNAVTDVKFKEKGQEVLKEERKEAMKVGQEKSTDLTGASFALGDNVKNLDFKGQDAPDKSELQKHNLENSVPATRVQDVRSKGPEKYLY